MPPKWMTAKAMPTSCSARIRGLLRESMKKSCIATAMITSVPGPMTTVHLLGHPVDDIIAFGPASGSIAVTTGLFSYRGRVRVAFAVDGHLCADARRLVDGWLAAQARLIGAA